MKHLITNIMLLANFALGSCASTDYDRRAVAYPQRSPNEEAQADYNNGDYRIYSAMGYARYYPGLDSSLGAQIAATHGERMIAGTTDAIEGSSHRRFIDAATDFAASYNKRKVALIRNANH